MGRRSRRTTSGDQSVTGAGSLPDWRGERIGVLGGVREAILAVMCGVMPWWFGSADPPAIFVMSCLILALAVATLIDGAVAGRRYGLGLFDCVTCLPVLAVGLAALYGFLQWVEVGPEILGTLSPTRLATWKSWGGGESIVLRAEPGVTIPSAGARLAWLDAEVFESVVWVGALWVVGVCVLRLPGRWGPLKRHGLVLSVSGTLMGLQSMLQALTWDGRVLWLRPKGVITMSSGPFFVHSELAAYLNLCLGFVLARLVFTRVLRDPAPLGDEFLRNRRPVLGEGALAIYGAGIGILAVLASGSRVGFLAMMLGMMVLGAIALRAKFRLGIGTDEFTTGSRGGNSGWYVILGLLGVVALGLTMLVDVFAIFGRVESIVSEGGSHAAGVRLAVWKLAAAAWGLAPLWGTGWGSFPWSAQPLIEAAGLGFVTHAESDYVQILPEGGLIGVGIVLLGLFGLARAGFSLVRGADRTAQFLLTAGALSGLTAVAWGAVTENVLRTSGVVIPALVTAAHVVRLALWKRRERTEKGIEAGVAQRPSKGLSGQVGGLALGVVLAAVAWPNVEGAGTMSRAWSSMERSRIQHAVAQFPSWNASAMNDEDLELERSGTAAVEGILPGWGDYHVRRAIAEVETFQRRTLAELKREGLPEAEATRLSRIMELAVVIRGLPPAGAAAAVEGLLGDPIVRSHLVPAARSLAAAWRTQPSGALTHLEAAILGWLFEKGPSVEDSLRRGIELAGHQAGLLIRAGQIASSLGDESMAVAAFAKVLARDGTDAVRIRPWLSADAVDRLTETSASAAVQAGELLMAEAETGRRHAAGRRALAKLGEVQGLEDAGTGLLRARAYWLSGERDKAIETVRLATAYSPREKGPRILLVEWLIASGQTGKALEEAKVLGYFWPKDAEVEKLMSRAAEADANGGGAAGAGTPVPGS